MLNRRHLRVKVLQTIYAYQLSEDRNIQNFEKSLLKSVDQVYEMYIWVLALLSEVSEYTLTDAEGRANKFLPSENDLNTNIKLANNTFIELLRQNEQFIDLSKKYKVDAVFDRELIRSIFHILKQSPEYIAYLENDDRSLKVEKDIIKFTFKKIILKSPAIEQVFEERFINWGTDKDVLQALLAKTLKNFNSEDPDRNKLAQLCPNWDDDKEFIIDLFRLTTRHAEDYQSYIAGKTKNWEADRIALIDTLLMRMAIAELINFSTIPVKVTINEYIEISKEFSTPKSNSFINGILDKILIELKDGGKVRKFGRGLIG
ncbi:transcription antitermination factor NusB [Olivibacter sp. SDN3]|uniref:transcription antitermination factor NusB n=1 Tax=Olivibacter sp. SDN3 TaxID=2764720 RepID=UPI0016515E7A|nr:transcription antitermination factor NusB [Olivibacter sp. SDN3]QNL49524.1 transcription antitermination factor NusB [Olivibacter sp. SDN3]